jgi:hypothetical protein
MQAAGWGDVVRQRRETPRNRQLPLVATLASLLVGTLASNTCARADEWVEHPYNPPIGSRWLIQAKQTSENDIGGRAQTSSIATKSELTVEQKLADGFRVTYVTRNTEYQGDARTAAIVGSTAGALDNVAIRGTLSLKGAPLRVENLDEVLAAARKAIDRFTAALAGNPQVAGMAGKMMARMLIADAEHAPRIYLASLLLLAAGQNTGLHPGKTQSGIEEIANPLNGEPIRSNTTLQIDSADPATGNVHYVLTRAFDPDAMKALAGSIALQIGSDDSKLSQKLGDLMKQISLTLDSRTKFGVEQGMTREISEEDTATTAVLGQKVVKHVHKQLTVAPAP